MILFQIMTFMFNRSICKLRQVKLKFFLWFIYWKHICIFSEAANDLQAHSRKLFQPDLQVSHLKLYIDHDNKNHFEVVRSTLKPNKTMTRITNLILLNHWWKIWFRENCLAILIKLIFQTPINPRQVYSEKQDWNPSTNAQHQQKK